MLLNSFSNLYYILNIFQLHSIVKTIVSNNEISIRVPIKFLRSFLHFFKSHSSFRLTQATDVVGYDAILTRSTLAPRFDVVYQLISYISNLRISLIVGVSPLHWVSSAWPIFLSAGWAEREVWDLFGVFFTGHTDLRRILTDYGFSGHALRKDFPLIGFTELQYSEITKVVSACSIEQTAEFRNFHLESTWFIPPVKS